MDELEEIRRRKLERLKAELEASQRVHKRSGSGSGSGSGSKAVRDTQNGATARDGTEAEQWPDQPIELTPQRFQHALATYPALVVDCWAPWCGPCQKIAPVIEILAKRLAGTVVFGKLNTDAYPQLAQRFQVSGIPTLLLFDNGVLVDRITGVVPGNALERRLRRRFAQ